MVIHGRNFLDSRWAFFVLVYLGSTPFWVASLFLKVGGLPDNLPVTDIGATFVPAAVGTFLVVRRGGWAAARDLLKRTVDFEKIQPLRWLLITVFLYPVLFLITWVLMVAIGLKMPATWGVPVQSLLVLVAFLAAAAGEELGYSGYAIDRMQEKYTPAISALAIGLIHALWHYPSMIQLGQQLLLMVTGTVFTIAVRILCVWLYNNTNGSVAASILFHAIGNTCRTLFPGGRAGFEQADAIVGYSVVTLVALLVLVFWKAKPLTPKNGIPRATGPIT